MGLGGAAVITNQKREPSGAPFTPTSARNGLSVDGAGMIVLGNDVGGSAADLISDRQVNQHGFSLQLTQDYQNLATGIGVDIVSTFNTLAGPTALAVHVADSGISTNAALLNVRGTVPGGTSGLLIPVRGALMVFDDMGFSLNTLGGSPGGISLNGTGPASNSVFGSAGMSMGINTSLLTPNTNAMTFLNGIGHSVDPPSGTMALVAFSGSFGPTSGTAEGNMVTISASINQIGGANGITRGLYINPNLISAADFRGLEVATGRSIFHDTISANDGTLPNGSGAWLLGNIVTGAVALDAAHYIEVSVGGVVKKLLIAA
jgi:hypothetical protein